MKEFLFRYRRRLIVILLLVIIHGIRIYLKQNYYTSEDESASFKALIYFLSAFIFSFFFHNYNHSDGVVIKFKHLNANYINGKYIYILSSYFVQSKKEEIFRDEQIKNEFGRANLKFYNNNISLFKKKNQGLVWAASKLSQVLKSRGKVYVIDFIISIATHDKYLSVKEIQLLRKMCRSMRVHYNTLDAILAMHNYQSEEELNNRAEQQKLKQYQSNSMERYFKILELPVSSTIDEIKSAYRRLVKLYHPDKKKGLQKQFLLVQEAYESIKNHKGFK